MFTEEGFHARTVRTDDGCLVWQGARDKDGYGNVWFDGATRGAHRVSFVLEHGPIPDGMTVDHLCFNRACVEPSHLQVLSRSDNSRRQRKSLVRECSSGHPFDQENTILRSRGSGRDCRACNRENARAYRARLKAAA